MKASRDYASWSTECLPNFTSAIASKTRKPTSAAALPLSTARSSLETTLSRSFSTATTKHLLFRLTAFAKSQRVSHECRSGVRTDRNEKARAMAGQEIDRLSDPSATEEERQRRKRRLLKGPKEFRDVRSNRPKFK